MPHESEPTPAEEQVRRLLAEARHNAPMPEDVATRLDRVLSGLSDERRDAEIADRSVAVAADLAAARRRRTARNLLIAAAAVVAVGFGLNAADLTLSSDQADSGASDAVGAGDSAGVGAPVAEAAPLDALGSGDRAQVENDGPTREEVETTDGATLDYQGTAAPLARLSEERFGTQVRRLQSGAWSTTLRDNSASKGVDGLFGVGRALRPGCSTQGWGAGLLVPVRYDGSLGALVFRDPHGETQVVDLFLCGTEEPTRSITLPAP